MPIDALLKRTYMKILHIVSSPRGDRSVTQKIASGFIDALKVNHPSAEVDELDVWETELLPFDGPALNAKYADLTGQEMTSDQKAVWEQISELGERFHRADLIMFSVPMWNFGIPYRLKHLIDVVSQRGILFSFDADGMKGLLSGKKVFVAAARGVALGDDYPREDYDHQIAYLRTWSKMVGIYDFQTVLNEMTLGGPEVQKANLEQAMREAQSIAENI